MCFSANASFGASAVLLAVGVVTQSKSKTVPQRIFATIPIIFSAQQFTEGILWFALSHPEYAYLQKSATYTFLVFAQMVWPLMIPFSALMMEQDPFRKKILAGLFGTGILTALLILSAMVFYNMHAGIDGHHIRYELRFPLSYKWYYGLLYFIPTIVTPFVSGIKGMKLLGVTLIGSYIISSIFYHYSLISIWCFIASAISLVVLYIILELNKEPKLVPAPVPRQKG